MFFNRLFAIIAVVVFIAEGLTYKDSDDNQYWICDVFGDPHVGPFDGTTYYEPDHVQGWMVMMNYENEMGIKFRVSSNNRFGEPHWPTKTVSHGVMIEMLNHNDHWEDLYKAWWYDDGRPSGDMGWWDQGSCTDWKSAMVETTPMSAVDANDHPDGRYQSFLPWDLRITIKGIDDFRLYTRCVGFGYMLSIQLYTRSNAKNGICVSEEDQDLVDPDEILTCPAVRTCCSGMVGGDELNPEYIPCIVDTFDDCCTANDQDIFQVSTTTCCEEPFMKYCGEQKNDLVPNDFECANNGVCDPVNGQCYYDTFLWNGVQKTTPKCSAQSCDQLTWDDEVFGETNNLGMETVCGHTFTDSCPGAQTFAEAKTFCEDRGARLCSRAEVMRGEGYGMMDNPCFHDATYIWTESACTVGPVKYHAVNFQRGNGDQHEMEADCFAETSTQPHGGRCCADFTNLEPEERVCRSDECGDFAGTEGANNPQSYIYDIEASNLEIERFSIAGPLQCGYGYHLNSDYSNGWLPVQCQNVGDAWYAVGCEKNMCIHPGQIEGNFAAATKGYILKYDGEFVSQSSTSKVPFDQVQNEVNIVCAAGYGTIDGVPAWTSTCGNQDEMPYSVHGCYKISIFESTEKWLMYYPKPNTAVYPGYVDPGCHEELCIDEFCPEDKTFPPVGVTETDCIPVQEPSLKNYVDHEVALTSFAVSQADKDEWGWETFDGRYFSAEVHVEPNHKVTIVPIDAANHQITAFNSAENMGEATCVIDGPSGEPDCQDGGGCQDAIDCGGIVAGGMCSFMEGTAQCDKSCAFCASECVDTMDCTAIVGAGMCGFVVDAGTCDLACGFCDAVDQSADKMYSEVILSADQKTSNQVFTVVVRTNYPAMETEKTVGLRVYSSPTENYSNAYNYAMQVGLSGKPECWGKIENWSNDFVPPGGVSWSTLHANAQQDACQWYGDYQTGMDQARTVCCADDRSNLLEFQVVTCDAMIREDALTCNPRDDTHDYEREGYCFADAVTRDERQDLDESGSIWGSDSWANGEDEVDAIYAWNVCPHCQICQRSEIGLLLLAGTRRMLQESGRGRLLQTNYADLVEQLVPGITWTPYVLPTQTNGRRSLGEMSEKQARRWLLEHVDDIDNTPQTIPSRRYLIENGLPLGFATENHLGGHSLTDKHNLLKQLCQQVDDVECRNIIQTDVQGQTWKEDVTGFSNEELHFPRTPMLQMMKDSPLLDEADAYRAVSYVLGQTGVSCVQTCMMEDMVCDESGFPSNAAAVKYMPLIAKVGGDINEKGTWLDASDDINSIFHGTCNPAAMLTGSKRQSAPAVWASNQGFDISSFGACFDTYSGKLTDYRCEVYDNSLQRFCPCVGGPVL